jgi:hypothetical protein
MWTKKKLWAYLSWEWSILKAAARESHSIFSEARNAMLGGLLAATFLLFAFHEHISLKGIIDGFLGVTLLAVLFFAYFLARTPYLLWLEERRKVVQFEDLIKPKLEIFGPFEHIEPKGETDRGFRTWRLRIHNHSMSQVKGCSVKKKSLINRLGHQSGILGIRFKRTIEQPMQLQAYPYSQSFNLNPDSDEYVDIVAMDERDANQRVFMMYAMHGDGAGAIPNAIAASMFPHTLVVEISAENVVEPLERTYEIEVVGGRLNMRTPS